jgi:integrase/recombinase XerC
VVREHLKAFLEHLRLNENASAHTVRAYDSDLSQLLAFLASHLDRRVSELRPADLDHLNARAFLADLNRKGNAKSSAARKLSAIRAFGRYLRHEGVLDGDPAALVGTPKREIRIPKHLAVNCSTRRACA